MGRNGRGLWRSLLPSANAARGTDLTSLGRPTRARKLGARYVETLACPSSSLSAHLRPSLGHSHTRPHWAKLNPSPSGLPILHAPTPLGHEEFQAVPKHDGLPNMLYLSGRPNKSNSTTL
ncbi:hypothetical protein AVEN_30263-1 [Araneus ventricosus]|uniref:Uncharacterized protein n=1 Tax=Araneus ventricosus TaxID=182803 RepID=A0A4Y2R5I8_ARAVE|nr:hypothetical protein AVEN_30263-1 [Araneus ventricosus]